ncbi:MAG: TonB-dependent receptor [Candidatus Pseudobacter hemicellulosilyticus]|uniref:TonB-dependent receptor n=1 Tax=Candidatus Pseudobacter hemicellulosilyticus TaxID=3121375 RepID=A0AAJ6BGK0_9BACT|nr:MAG: TonB-dependent receptor [Pseudobacter sp.]
MRVGTLTSAILLTASLQLLLAADGKGQRIDQVDIRVTLKKESLVQAFRKIEARSPFHFMYRMEEVQHVRNLSLKDSQLSVEALLQQLLRGTSLSYKQVNNQILIMAGDGRTAPRGDKQPPDHLPQELPPGTLRPSLPGRADPLSSFTITADTTIIITGLVRDRAGTPLDNVSVMLAGSQRGTVTNSKGEFSIRAAENDSLVFSSVGFLPMKRAVGNTRIFDITLVPQDATMSDVVIVGFGTQKKESVIGAITTISPEKLQSNQTRSLTNALAGQIAGVIGVKRSGEPGYDASDIWIRGINTFGVNSVPLVMVDGVERSLDNISPDEIASFSVLKDATATAIYGVRGANGAIIIKTKRGSVGKPRISLNADYGVSTPIRLPDYIDGARQMEIINEARKLSGGNDFYSQGRIDSTRLRLDPDLYPNVDWIDQVTDDYATNSRINLDINGGTDRLRYRFMVGMFDEKGIIATNPNAPFDSQLKLKRYNVRSNIDMDLTSSTLFSVSIGGYIINRNAPGTSAPTILDWSMQTPPIVHPAVYSTGEFPKNVNRANPWVQATETGYQKNYQNSIQSILSVEQNIGKLWKPMQGLTAKFLFSFDAYNWHNIQRTRDPNFYMASGRDAEGNLLLNLVSKGQEFLNFSKSSGGNRNMYMEIPVSYNRTFADHSVSGLILYNRKDFVNVDATNAIQSFPYRNEGLAGRFTYDFDKRYFGEFNFGYNGSENLQKGNRYGFFPSFALGWMVSNEAFMQSVTFIDRLKIRGSWGKVGNEKISNDRRFGYVTTINSTGGYRWGWNNQLVYDGVQEGDFGVPNLTWETAAKTDIGIDLSLFNALSIQVDFFQEKRSNIFMLRKTIPELAGYVNTPYANFGKVENKGFDASIEYNKRFSGGVTLSLLANITHASNKIIEYDEPAGLIGTNRSRTGYSINQNFGLIADGLYTDKDFSNPNTGVLRPGIPQPLFGKVMPGDIKYFDVNGDGKVGADDEVPIGNPSIPETVYGFGISVKYRQFDAGFLCQGITNVDFIISGNEMIPGSGDGSIGNILSNVDDRWTPENPRQDAFYPRLSRSKSENNNQASTWWLKNGSFLRLKYVEVGYTLVKEKKPGNVVSNARLFLRGSDLLTISSFKLWDPELAGTGYRSYPSSKIVSLGFSVNF